MTGKTQIRINGTEVKLYFGMPANRMFWQQLENHPGALNGDKLNETGIGVLLHSGYVNACLIYDITPTVRLGEFFEYVDIASINDSVKSELQNAVKTYEESVFTKSFGESISEQLEAVNDKKKLSIGMTSNSSDMDILNSQEGSI